MMFILSDISSDSLLFIFFLSFLYIVRTQYNNKLYKLRVKLYINNTLYIIKV